MKSFTAKEFSRCPAKVYESARVGGRVEITHDRFGGVFTLKYEQNSEEYFAAMGVREFSDDTQEKAPN